jgi:hypothetical protein
VSEGDVFGTVSKRWLAETGGDRTAAGKGRNRWNGERNLKTLKCSLEKFVVAKIALFKEEEENWRTVLLIRKTGTQNVKPRLLLPRSKLFVLILKTTVVTSPDGQLCQTTRLLTC